MLLSSGAGQRLKPVGIMGRAFFHRPLLHGFRDLIGHQRVQVTALIHGLMQLIVHILRKARSHDLIGKHILSVDV